jgi:hypothetical protein
MQNASTWQSATDSFSLPTSLSLVRERDRVRVVPVSCSCLILTLSLTGRHEIPGNRMALHLQFSSLIFCNASLGRQKGSTVGLVGDGYLDTCRRMG